MPWHRSMTGAETQTTTRKQLKFRTFEGRQDLRVV